MPKNGSRSFANKRVVVVGARALFKFHATSTMLVTQFGVQSVRFLRTDPSGLIVSSADNFRYAAYRMQTQPIAKEAY
jgi:hypothetical protein